MRDGIAALQRRVGVTADGVFGPATLAAVHAALDRAGLATKPAPRIGPRAIALLHHFESCRLTAYKCPAGIWTIGWGNTFYTNGKPVQEGDTITQATADELFRVVVRKFEDGVAALAPDVAPHEFGAMVSLAYNIGLANFERSSVLRNHNAGDRVEAAGSFLLWNKGGGNVLPGLVRRREAERLLYLNQLDAFDKAIGYRA